MQQQCNKCDSVLEDQISGLPIEVLACILSRLCLKEAVRTSILSAQWRHVWTLITRLNFNKMKAFQVIKCYPELHKAGRQSFVKWVNHVLELHEAGTLEEFKVSFSLDRRFNVDIHDWIRFALLRKVQRLQLELSLDWADNKDCTFPFGLFSQSEDTCLSSRFGIRTNGILAGIQFLKEVCLTHLDVGDEVVEFLLSNCPDLERLSVHHSFSLVSLNVGGAHSSLKYLEIGNCKNIKSIAISDANLVSFSYIGRHTNLFIKNVPSLVNLCIGGDILKSYFGLSMEDFFAQLSCCLKTLTVQIYDSWLCPKASLLTKLTTLERLTLKIIAWDDEMIGHFAWLIYMCPRLLKFEFQVTWSGSLSVSNREVMRRAKPPHRFLKEVKLGGYFGRKSDLELALFFFQNAVALEKMVIDPRSQDWDRYDTDKYDTKRQRIGRSRAKQQLEAIAPAGVNLVIL
ncbi:hypothetical protein Vadar_017793 [Vaccinium darrowii]|uniref:Uncharacterized protein n=1 Tax=Vaccinium darrowii TaxID=229202 RepID=A0ACB7YWW2_9ERIC|nr:hypothetical protein Vadar_017793 [Vaccinium darrowii]